MMPSPLDGLFRPGIEYPTNLENRMRLLMLATGGHDICVRAMDDTGTAYMACADRPAEHSPGMTPVATAYAYSSVAALDKLAAKLGFTVDDDGHFVRAARVEDVREVEVA